MGTPRVIIAAREPEFAVGYAPGLLVSSWAGRVTDRRVAVLESLLPALIEASPDSAYVAISVIEASTSMRVDEDARARSARLQRRMKNHMRGHAYLVEGDGFLPATVRTLTAGQHLMTRSTHPLKVFKDPLVMGAWVAEKGALSADVVLRTVAALRPE